MKVFVVDPDVLREFELPDKACANNKRGDSTFLAIFWRAFSKVRTIGRSWTNHAPAIYVGGCVARIHAADVRAERDSIPVWVHFFVVKIIGPLHIRAKLRIISFRREHKRRAAAPAAHELSRDQFLFFRRFAMLAQKITECTDMLLHAAIRHVLTVAGKDFRLRQRWNDLLLVGITENELARFHRPPKAGSRLLP